MPKHFLHNNMNRPYAQARRVKDIGRVLREYYGEGRTITSKRRIRQSIKMSILQWKRCSLDSREGIVSIGGKTVRRSHLAVDGAQPAQKGDHTKRRHSSQTQ